MDLNDGTLLLTFDENIGTCCIQIQNSPISPSSSYPLTSSSSVVSSSGDVIEIQLNIWLLP